VARGVTQEKNAKETIKKHKTKLGTPTGCGQNIDEERRMRLNLQVMVGLKKALGHMGK
jgi:hypothetical protein